jgi:hypothetical protein
MELYNEDVKKQWHIHSRFFMAFLSAEDRLVEYTISSLKSGLKVSNMSNKRFLFVFLEYTSSSPKKTY